MEPVPLPRSWLLRALEIETDREHDARQRAREAVRAFRGAVEESGTADSEAADLRSRLEVYALRLKQALPGDPSLAAILDRAVETAGRGPEPVLAELDAALEAMERSGEALVAAAAAVIRPGARILTHSFSETVERLVKHYADRLERVTVCESRPLNEGARLAEAIAELAIPVRLITEGELELFAGDCDLAIVEAERILPDGGVVARAGTGVLARVCAAHQVPLYVAAESSRRVPENDELARFRPERRSPAEILPNPPQGVEVVNVAFDLTPPDLVAGYLTEDGVEEVKNRA